MRTLRFLGSVFAAAFAVGLLSPSTSYPQATVDVWIDPGHGGPDKGNLGYDKVRVEKNIALQLSAHLYNSLGAIGYSSYFTRLSDYYPTLSDRAAMASGNLANINGDRAVCQLFISMHLDARSDPGKFGTTTYYPKFKLSERKKNSVLISKQMGETIHPKLMQNAALAFFGCNQDLHVLSRNFEVLRESTVPSILIESCMLTNQCQQNKIAANGNQGIVTDGIAAGVSFAISPGGPVPQRRPSGAAAPIVATQTEHDAREAVARPAAAEQVQIESEGFEGSSFPPAGWTTTTLGGPAAYTWQRTTDTLYVHGGVGAALVGGESPGAIDEWLISPATFLGSADRAVSFYWSANRYFASSVNAECLVKPIGSSTWTRIWQLLDEPSGGEWEWKQRVASLVPWAGNSVQVAFRVSGTNGGDVNIDDFAIGDFVTTAPPANDLCAHATPLPARSFSLSGTTIYAANDADPAKPDSTACSVEPISSGDVFYSFHASSDDTLQATVTADWPAVVYVVDGCDGSTADCLVMAGQYEPIGQDGTGFTYVFGSSGQYFLVVDGMDGEAGAFQLTGLLHGPTTGVGDPPPSSTLSLAAFPNPTVQEVEFRGAVPTAAGGSASVRVVDVSGRTVAVLKAPVAAGTFRVRWKGLDAHGQRARAGVYFARIESSGQQLTRTFVIAP